MSGKKDRKERKIVEEEVKNNISDHVEEMITHTQEMLKGVIENQAALDHNLSQQAAVINELVRQFREFKDAPSK